MISDSATTLPAREAAVEILALNVFGLADRDGVVVTRKLVDKRMAEHADGCDCGLCALVDLAAPSKVFWTASRWQWSINRTRARATR